MEWATDQGSPERLNEDFVAAAAGAVVVLDGCGLPLGTDLGCVHGTAWYARSLGTRLLARMLDGAGPPAGSPVGPPEGAHRPGTRPLVARLAGAIADVAAAHRLSCDLRVPTTPAATVLALRLRGELVDYLVLADSTVLLEGGDGVREITGGTSYAAADPAVARRRGHRHRPGGRAAPRGPADRRRDPARRHVRRHRLGRPGRAGGGPGARRPDRADAGDRADRPAGGPLAAEQGPRRRDGGRVRVRPLSGTAASARRAAP
ncbi:hypothetical protein LUX33_42780 [Actinomadura madurae]|uniref:hypothetical protein n=1 Tax=Actinomadura madurae TaxID=1993 RepID=UPI0020D25AE9|nr:hypothetical protein [Actinomadura madurae]MCP9954464.1 hypothetical protein [Actinomadura madurae]